MESQADYILSELNPKVSIAELFESAIHFDDPGPPGEEGLSGEAVPSVADGGPNADD